MYESHHQPETLTDMDYQLLLEANTFAKCDPNMVDFNHPDYMSLMQAHSLPLDPSLVDQTYHHKDPLIGSDSSSSSNEHLYYNHHNQQQQQQQQQHDHPSLDLQQPSSLQIHFSNSDESAPAHNSSIYMASSAPVTSSMAPITNSQSNNDHSSIITRQNISVPSSSSSSSLSSASYYAPVNNNDRHPSQNHHPYQQNYGNRSDPSVYPSLEEYVSTTSSTFYINDPSSNNNNNNSSSQINSNSDMDEMEAAQYHHLEQFYGQSLDEQQQFFLMQQHQQQLWVQQQQQYQHPHQHQHQHHHQQMQQQNGYPASHHPHARHVSPSSTSSVTAYTTESDPRPQIYVRKACVACKQSHVACDVQRPCSRCVRLNKAESCVDAERKKRGRPCGSGKKKKEEEKELRRREQQQQQQQQQLHLQHSLLR